METLILLVEEMHRKDFQTIHVEVQLLAERVSTRETASGEESGSAGADRGSASCTGSRTTAAPETA